MRGMSPDAEVGGTRFFRRLCLGFVGLVLVTSAAIGALVDSRVRADLLDSVEARLASEAAYLGVLAAPVLAADGPVDGPVGELAARAAEAAATTGSRLTVMRADGTVIVDTRHEPATMDNHLTRPEVQQALSEGRGRASRFSGTLGVDLLYVALPVRVEGRLVGICRASLPLVEVERHTARVRRIVGVGAIGAALLGMVLAMLYARRVTAPLAQMTAAVESLTRGRFARVDVPEGDDEIVRLGAAFNTMAAQLRERVALITANHNQVLAILGSMVEGVVAVDREDRVLHMNAVAGRLLGLVPEQCTGRRLWELTRELELSQALAHARETGEASRLEVELRSGTEMEPRTLQLNASPILDEDGARSGAVVVVNDLTELRRLEAIRRDFVANVSHELKTPLAAIRAMVEMLVEAPDLSEEQRQDFHRRVLAQGDRLATLVADLLTLARIESAGAAGGRADVPVTDLKDPIDRARTRFGPRAQKRGIAVEFELAEGPAPVRADEEDLREILDNLLDNAIKYTPAGGTVTLTLEREGQRIRLSVADTGVGIEPVHRERIFERFYRADKARSRELGGTGLGLAIVKHLVQSMGGTIEVASTPGRGSTFTVRLPAAAEKV